MSAAAPRLLVVEDDAEILAVVRETLEEDGYGITAVNSLHSSLAALEDHLFHFILTDLFYRQGQPPIQSIQPLLEKAAPIPVGVLTSWPVPTNAVAEANLAFLIAKPFDIDNLLSQMYAQVHPTLRSARQRYLVQEFFQALNNRDWTRVERLCAPGAKAFSPLATSLSSVGLPVYLEAIERRWNRLPGYCVEEVDLFDRSDGLAARYLSRWQGRDGIEHRATGSLHFRFHHGHIAQIEGAF